MRLAHRLHPSLRRLMLTVRRQKKAVTKQQVRSRYEEEEVEARPVAPAKKGGKAPAKAAAPEPAKFNFEEEEEEETPGAPIERKPAAKKAATAAAPATSASAKKPAASAAAQPVIGKDGTIRYDVLSTQRVRYRDLHFSYSKMSFEVLLSTLLSPPHLRSLMRVPCRMHRSGCAPIPPTRALTRLVLPLLPSAMRWPRSRSVRTSHT